jgi:hypothetical protein
MALAMLCPCDVLGCHRPADRFDPIARDHVCQAHYDLRRMEPPTDLYRGPSQNRSWMSNSNQGATR